ncbi:MAG: hypothetical protein INR70_17890 [Parafilimonas terrae]|nr:hypothetical protein [Parafilimonas terrae]
MLNMRVRARRAALISSGMLVGSVLVVGPARAEPPIRSPEDAACRLEARAKVFSAPNPQGLELEQIGRQIYFACMSRLDPARAVTPKRSRHRRKPRRH